MGSVLYKEDRLRESAEHYKIAVALAPQDRHAAIATRILRRVFFMFISLAFVTSTASLLTVVLPRRQALLSLANTLGDAYRQEASI